MQLYVSGLNWEMEEEGLKELFSQYGDCQVWPNDVCNAYVLAESGRRVLTESACHRWTS
jgi:hypothetical protein